MPVGTGQPSADPATVPAAGWRAGLSYGALGLPLAFVALPLYVILPNHYATAFGIPLATLGALLLGARLLDALVDPLIGRWADGWLAHSARRALLVAVAAAFVLALGFRGLFFPPAAAREQATLLLLWCAALLAVTYFSFSLLSVLHQAWGARLGGNPAQRARVVSWREGLALVGVLVASVLPALAGLSAATLVFALTLALGVAALWRAPAPESSITGLGPVSPMPASPQGSGRNSGPASGQGSRPVPSPSSPSTPLSLRLPLATPAFRRLLLVYLVNGVASAVPATLVLFFVRDRLQAPNWEPVFLAAYFAAAALSMPLWLRLVRHLGLARAWLCGMGLAVAAFVWAAFLGAGDTGAFAVVCLASGVALGADLAIPGALLAGVIQRAGHGQRLEGGYFGWWNFATKLNLALAAGIALPLLAWFGYSPGVQAPGALQALTAAYCLLPCILKLLAALLLWQLWLKKETEE